MLNVTLVKALAKKVNYVVAWNGYFVYVEIWYDMMMGLDRLLTCLLV